MVFTVVLFCVIAFFVFVIDTYYETFYVDRNVADYIDRIEYLYPKGKLPDKSNVVAEFELSTLTKVFRKGLHNPFIDQGPFILAYPLQNKSPRPAIIIMPGGGYGFRSEKMEGIQIAQWANENCIAAFVLNYRLAPYPASLEDSIRAVQYIRANHQRFNIDPTKIGVMGFSAGGHLAATVSTLYDRVRYHGVDDEISLLSAKPDFTVLAYPVVSFLEYAHVPSRDNLIGPNSSEELNLLLSPNRQVTADTPLAFAWTTKTDAIVPYQNAELYTSALLGKGVNAELTVYPEGLHGSGLAIDEQYASDWTTKLLLWLVDVNIMQIQGAESCL